MMQFIRSQVAGIFAKLLFLLLIASFAVWGIGDIFTGDRGGQAVIEIDPIFFKYQPNIGINNNSFFRINTGELKIVCK